MCESDIIKDTTVNSFEELASLVQKFRKDGNWIFRGEGILNTSSEVNET